MGRRPQHPFHRTLQPRQKIHVPAIDKTGMTTVSIDTLEVIGRMIDGAMIVLVDRTIGVRSQGGVTVMMAIQGIGKIDQTIVNEETTRIVSIGKTTALPESKHELWNF